MSVINQVLTQLERRGVHVEQEQGLVRAVPPQRPGRTLPLLLVALLLVAGVGLWLARGAVVDVAKPVVTHVERVQPVVPVPHVESLAVSGVVAADAIIAQSGVPSAVSAVAVASSVQEIQPQSSVMKVETRPKPRAKLVTPTVPEKTNTPPLVVPDAPRLDRVLKLDAASGSAQPMVEVLPANGGMPMKQVSRSQQADAEFRRGIELMQRGRSREAIDRYQAALQLDSAHDAARQALVALLLEDKRSSDAEQLLQTRLMERPQHTGFAMLLARMQVERGATGEALTTLERSLPYAGTKADYLAFLAAIQQRSNRFDEAASNYLAALQLQPGNGIWLMGYGISLQSMQRNEEAKAVYQQALDSKTLSPDLQAFIQRKLKNM